MNTFSEPRTGICAAKESSDAMEAVFRTDMAKLAAICDGIARTPSGVWDGGRRRLSLQRRCSRRRVIETNRPKPPLLRRRRAPANLRRTYLVGQAAGRLRESL